MTIEKISDKSAFDGSINEAAQRKAPAADVQNRQQIAQATSDEITPEMMQRGITAQTLLYEFVDKAYKEMFNSGDPNVDAVKAFKTLLERHSLMFVPDRKYVAATIYGVSKKDGKETLNLSMQAGLELFELLLSRSKDDEFCKNILIGIVIKEGATVKDIMDHVSRHVEIVKQGQGYDPAKTDDEATKKLAVQLTDTETLGYKAMLDYFERNQITPVEIKKHGEKEQSDMLGAMLRMYYGLMTPLAGKTGDEKTFLIREFVFIDHIASIYPAITKRLLDIGVREGKAQRDPATGRYSGSKEALSFLGDPKYLDRE
ncbi:MAG: hypothetical protein WC527_04365 [Candidatus Margulisiibacteriota bacterium]